MLHARRPKVAEESLDAQWKPLRIARIFEEHCPQHQLVPARVGKWPARLPGEAAESLFAWRTLLRMQVYF
jgi:hypothetical protein